MRGGSVRVERVTACPRQRLVVWDSWKGWVACSGDLATCRTCRTGIREDSVHQSHKYHERHVHFRGSESNPSNTH